MSRVHRATTVERVKEAADIVEIDLRAHRPAAPGRALHGAVPVPRGAHAVVLGRPAGEALPLLRLRGGRRRDQVRRGEGGARVSRGGRGARRALRGRARARGARTRGPRRRESAARGSGSCSSGPPPSTRRFLWDSPQAAKARDYLAGRGLGEEVLRAFGGRLRAERLGPGADARPAGGLLGRGDRGGGPGLRREAQGGHYDRFRSRIMFPVRDAARAGAGLRRAGAAPRPEAEVPELAGGRAVLEEPHAVRDRPGAAAMVKGGRAVVVEGYTDVLACHQAGIEEAVAVMGTAITPGAAPAALGLRRGGRAGAGRRPRGPRGDAARAARGRRSGCGCASPRCRAGEDPADMLAGGDGGAPRRSGRRSRTPWTCRCSTSSRRSTTPTSRSPAGRDRALDEVVPVLAAMRESISRDELMREVGDRLDADPGLVAQARGTPAGTRRRPAKPRADDAAPASERPRGRRGARRAP